VTIGNLAVTNPDFLSVVTSRPESERERCVLDVIAVGSTAMLRVQTTIDVDFVEKQFATLNSKFERALDGFEKQATSTLTEPAGIFRLGQTSCQRLRKTCLIQIRREVRLDA
jgi:hypothetical protein